MLAPTLRRSVLLATVVLGCCARGGADGGTPPRAAATAMAGGYVLLTNGNVLEGHAHQQGEWVLVRNGEGNETQLPRQNVACWAESLEDLYQFRVDRRRSGDIEALLNDARWCLHHDLLHLAAEAIREIYQLDPQNAQAKLIEIQLRRRTAPPDQPTATVPIVQTAAHEAPAEVPLIDVRSLRRFAGQVQPMLANRCGSCHSEPCDLPWTLVLPPHGARASSRMTRDNLQSSLAFLSPDSPDQSVLLTKALTAHGGGEAPLDPRDAKAIESLRGWIHEAAAAMVASQPPTSSPTPGDSTHSGSAPRRSILDSAVPATEAPAVATASFLAPLESPLASPAEVPASASLPTVMPMESRRPPSAPAASRLPQVANPFDPEIFNRRFHRGDRPRDTLPEQTASE